MKRIDGLSALLILLLTACAPDSPSTVLPPSATATWPPPITDTATFVPPTFTSIPTFTHTPTATLTHTPLPIVESLKATVTADLLSCRYGPGAPYLFLYGLRKGANIILIGQTGGNNWVWVEGKNKCWVHTNYIEIAGDKNQLPVVYPGIATLPISPYYPPTSIRSVTRNGNQVTVEWQDIPLRAGDEEDERMLHYIVETWRCEGGQYIFDPIATNDLTVTFIDESGCSAPSRGRIFVQEKHGFSGPTEIPWPAR